jgi:hypothetical protein
MPKTQDDYRNEGPYRLGKTYSSTVHHNTVTWRILENHIENNGGIGSFDGLSALCKEHKHGTKTATQPYQFVTYCIRSGWLVPTRQETDLKV